MEVPIDEAEQTPGADADKGPPTDVSAASGTGGTAVPVPDSGGNARITYEGRDDPNGYGRSTNDYDDDDMAGINFVDHFSLGIPSSTVKFRGARVHVYDSANEQFLLEDRGPDDPKDGTDEKGSKRRHTVTVKRMNAGNFGLRFLRLAYTLVAFLLVGCLWVLCFQIILFIFLNLPINSGGTSQEDRSVPRFIGTILSIPLMLYSMASAMSIGTTFLTDTWNGGRLLRSVFGVSVVVSEVLFFLFFLGIPLLAFIITLMAGMPDAWETSATVWLYCVAIVFCVCALAVVWHEVTSCFKLIMIHRGPDDEGEASEQNKWKRWFNLAKRALLLSQTQRLSGLRQERYLVSGEDEQPSEGFAQSPDYTAAQQHTSHYSRITQLACCSNKLKMFERLDPPRRLYTTQEVRDVLPFITSHSWSLEAMCCRNQRARMITAAKGPAALRPGQVISSVFCNIFGTLMVALFIIGVMVWLEAGALFYAIAGIICLFCCLMPMTQSSLSMYRMYKNINEDDDGFDEEAEYNVTEATNNKDKTTMFQVWETLRVTRPRPWYCYTRVLLDVVFLFLWPLGTLFVTKNYPIAIVFLVVGIFSFLRIYFDASALLSELGSLSNIDVEERTGEGKQHTRLGNIVFGEKAVGHERVVLTKARLSQIVGNISKNASIRKWTWFFLVLVLLVFLLFLSAVSSDDVKPGERPPIVLVDDFYYPGVPGLAYPTCEMTKGFTIPGAGSTALGDYAFLAALAYEMPNITEQRLAEWFGTGVAVDEDEFVEQYRKDSGTADNPVYFKLFSFPELPGYGIVSIRGSQTSWDWLVNMQLWSSAALTQVVKWFIPFGWVWSPIYDDLVTAVNFIESESLKRVAYYRVTTAFVNDVLAGYGGSDYDTLRVTGASLGGGLAVITGAQTEANAVAISGLGAKLSRHTFDPPITEEQLNNKVFNFIPDRDIIARIGGRSRLFQEAQCDAPKNNLFGCHSMWRSVCEISYRCGSGGRPVICRCVEKFGYPPPEPKQNDTNLTFAEACAVDG